MVGEPTAWRLLSIHNLAFVLGLMTEARAAIGQGRFDELRARTAEVWGALRAGGVSPGLAWATVGPLCPPHPLP